jgi:polysaccharide deacetylase 2 family uncharacterized protein YibQ
LQGNRALADQAAARLAATGRGLLVADSGLNAALRAAEAAGVPARAIYRDLDGARQDPTVIRRFLDDAAFRARQQGEIVVLARLRPATLSALSLWAAADRSGQVARAPLSAILRRAGD